MNITIKKAKDTDLDFLVALENRSFSAVQKTSEQNIKYGLKSSAQSVFIALYDNQNAGAVVLLKYRKTLRIYSVAVLPEFRGKGIGDTLIQCALNYGRKHSFERIVLEANENDIRLLEWYASKGFIVVDAVADYYDTGVGAIKMEYKLDSDGQIKKMLNVIVINQPSKWLDKDLNASIITVKEYINNPEYQNSSNYRIFNLCSSYSYQSYGYYVSLLATARGQRVIPNITTIRDFRIMHVIHSAAYDIDELINTSLKNEKEKSCSFNVYFGQTSSKVFRTLAAKLYTLFEAPLFKVSFVKHEHWMIKEIKVLTLSKIPETDTELLYSCARTYFNRKKFSVSKIQNFKYHLAILVNPEEETPPSCPDALKRFKIAANKNGVYVEFITKSDVNKINEFDALFIRETTNVNDHTYEISRIAYAEGLIVMDDPWSILKCSNKIYQNEIFRKHKILTPETTIYTKNIFNKKVLDSLSYPVVLKQPDSAFSLGISKAENAREALDIIQGLFKHSDMVVCQQFLYSDYDWRVGILDNKPIFACKYYMSEGHWQIYDWKSEKQNKAGASETLPVEEVPEKVLKTALKAASIMGDGLYGVDVKMVDDKVYVVEVNDNPNIDYEIEDLVLKDRLYELVIESFVRRIEVAKNIRKIHFSSR